MLDCVCVCVCVMLSYESLTSGQIIICCELSVYIDLYVTHFIDNIKLLSFIPRNRKPVTLYVAENF